MRRIEFIAPVDAMRGNLSGNQVLQYATNNNPAFDAPDGRQYANNYQPRYIGAKRAASGKKIFSVKTKAATKINAASKLRMALLGGAGALYAAMLKNETIMAQAEIVYGLFVSRRGEQRSFRKFYMDQFRATLSLKKVQTGIAITDEHGTLYQVHIKNPWVYTEGEPECPVSDEVLVKFWLQLATNPIVFKVDGAKGVAHEDETFAQIIDGNHNVLGLSEDSETNDVKLDDLFVVYRSASDILQVKSSFPVDSDGGYGYFTQDTEGGGQG